MVLGVQMLRRCPDQTKYEAERQAYIAAGEASFQASQAKTAKVKAVPGKSLEDKERERQQYFDRLMGRD